MIFIWILKSKSINFSTVVQGGAAAGSCVDLAIYPLDTLKTRLQSQYGFIKSGGFRGIYKGIGATSIGSPVTGNCGEQ